MSEIAYHYFDLSPSDANEPLSLDDARSAITTAFPAVEMDDHAALDNARRRFEALSKLGAPAELARIYENPKVTRMRLTEDSLGNHFIEFDLWDRQGIIVYPKPDEEKLSACQELAAKVGEVLGYDLKIEVYD